MHDPANLPVEVRPDRTLRVKIIDACGLACQFCHNEGTPVTTDNTGRAAGEFVGAPGRTGRVSIYLKTNGANFLLYQNHGRLRFRPRPCRRPRQPAHQRSALHGRGTNPSPRAAQPDQDCSAPRAHRRAHLERRERRGRPARGRGHGLDRINLSVFGTTPDELAAVQAPRLASPKLAARKLDALTKTIEAAREHGIKVSANIVIPDSDHVERVLRIIEQHGRSVIVRMLVSLEDDGTSLAAMQEVVDHLGAVPVRRVITAGASDQRVRYRLPDGRTLYAKSIRPVRLPETCADCRFNNPDDCQEGYYGVRMYRATDGPFMVGVCIQRMDLCMPLGEFVMSQRCGEVTSFREDETARLTRLHSVKAARPRDERHTGQVSP